MDVNIEDSTAFIEWIDPESGVRSFILDRRVAPQQQSFYFVNESFSANGDYLWFYTSFPPSGSGPGGRSLGVLHTATGEAHHFPDTQFSNHSPMVDAATGEVYWVSGVEIWKRSPDPATRPKLVSIIPQEIVRNRVIRLIATHLTRSADGARLNIDAQIGREWFVGTVPVDGGPPEIWQTFDRCYNHAQFSPTDPDLMLLAQDWWYDANSGEHTFYEDRLWLLRRGEQARPIFPDNPSDRRSHEWWQADGSHVWYVDYDKGTEKVNLTTGEATNVWPNGTCHSYCDRTGTYVVGDIGTYSWSETGCRVAFFNSETEREVDIASSLPEPAGGRTPYHVDPHPRFCLNDTWICYTTTVRQRPDLALTPVSKLIARTAAG